MTRTTDTSAENTLHLSETEKSQKGWNMPSFAKRMRARLAKIRREDDFSKDTFLLRHGYSAATHARA